MPLAARIVPTKPGIPRRQDPRRRSKQEPAEPAMRRSDQVAQLTADVKTGAARMLRRHQLVEDQPKLRSLDPDKLKALDRTGARRKTHRLGNRHLPASHGTPAAATAGRRKNDPARPLKTAKGNKGNS